ncbi:MAG: hypothetical protein IJ812_07930 [Schwartzia sp.]|nr:hypothetical protein [Schwartzia sp. (in: firmicutes)]MBR1886324.1 hypothetical protein [Schwartzia sp. (in: firmicutes)]
MAKIPKNLSDKDMFKGWQEEPTIEETMLQAATPKQTSRPQAKRTPAKDNRDGAYQTYLAQDAIDTMEKLLLEIKLDLFRQGISDYRVNVRREGNTVLLEHIPVNGTKK